MLKNDPSSKIKKVANQILLPRLVISQAPVPYNLTRTGSLNSFAKAIQPIRNFFIAAFIIFSSPIPQKRT